jgi:two-component system, chemotaxis family, sensor kinase CheA
MNLDMDQHKAAFKEEAYDILGTLEELLLQLEDKADDKELVSAVFRELHTLKGSGSMFGFEDMAGFAHQVENVFDLVRKEELSVTKELINLSLEAKDHIKSILDNPQMDAAEVLNRNLILDSIKALTPGELASVSQEEDIGTRTADTALSVESEEGGSDVIYRIRVAPSLDVQESGSDLIGLFEELGELGTSRVTAYLNNVPLLEELDAESCCVYWDILLVTSKGIDSIKDVFIFIEDQCKITIDVIDEGRPGDEEIDYKKLGHILVEKGDLSAAEMEEVVVSQKRFGEILVDKGLVENEKVESALAEQKLVREIREQKKYTETLSTIKVSSDKLDAIVDLVGELVIMQSNLKQLSTIIKNRDLSRVSKMANRLIWELREQSMDMRMSPIGNCFSKFLRLVRDLSSQLGKEVEMATEGGETELDKTIIDRLNDPLIHIIRNCIDHGIEDPLQREKSGKDRKGTIHLTASHSGPFILIDIRDDGAGIDLEAVKKRALDRGLIKEDQKLTESELYTLIFNPGFSTAKSVSSVSGRGVGMDVVKKNIEALRGSIHIESKLGEGTSVLLKIPLTLVIIDGLLLEVGKEKFIIPLALVERVVELKKGHSKKKSGGDYANIRGELIPFINLRKQFDIDSAIAEIEQIVIIEGEERKVGFVVDKVVGEHQTVIKSLGSIYKNIVGLSGATILGDGTIALILDAQQLIQSAQWQDQP